MYTSSAEKLDLKSKNLVGKNITVYIDPDNPSESMLDSDPYPAFWVWLMPFVGVVLIIVGIVKVKKT